MSDSSDTEKRKYLPAQGEEHLTAEQFYICRKKGTEMPFSGQYHDFYETGIYICVCCRHPQGLFDSSTKFDSGTGWPSFWAPIAPEVVELKKDSSLGLSIRTEVLCRHCGAHLGHVFNDGPLPTGLRYCINSLALQFISS